jgi:hypothetical protein
MYLRVARVLLQRPHRRCTCSRGGGDGCMAAAAAAGDGEPAGHAKPQVPQQTLRRNYAVVQTATAPPAFVPCRLPAALTALLPGRYATESAAKKAARRGEVWLDGARATTEALVAAGSVIEVRGGPSRGAGRGAAPPAIKGQWPHRRRPPRPPTRAQVVQRCGADALPAAGRPGLAVVYEDAHMACVVKPQARRRVPARPLGARASSELKAVRSFRRAAAGARASGRRARARAPAPPRSMRDTSLRSAAGRADAGQGGGHPPGAHQVGRRRCLSLYLLPPLDLEGAGGRARAVGKGGLHVTASPAPPSAVRRPPPRRPPPSPLPPGTASSPRAPRAAWRARTTCAGRGARARSPPAGPAGHDNAT